MDKQYKIIGHSPQFKLGDNLNEDDCLFCYMNPQKFENFLKDGLSLTRADLFTKDDPFEAEFTERIYELVKGFSIEPWNGLQTNGLKELKDQCDKIRKHSFVSCWTGNSNENVALWRLYGGSNSIAVRTSVDKVKKGLESFLITAKNKKSLMLQGCSKRIIKIEYINHRDREDQQKMLNGDATDILHFKNVGYEYEGEVRVIIDSYQRVETGFNESTFGKSITIKIRPENFIEEVLISPYASKCYFDSIKKMMEEFSLETKVNWSSLKWVPGEPRHQ